MVVALCIIAFLLLLIELDLSNTYSCLDRIASNLSRNADHLTAIENRLRAIERRMDKETNNER